MSAKTIIRHVLTGLAFLVAYVALDYVSYVKPYRNIGITPWNPPAGLAIALVFLEGLPIVPFVMVAPFVADIVVRQIPLPLEVDAFGSLLVGSTFVAAGVGLRRITDFDPRFRKVRDVLTLVVIGGRHGDRGRRHSRGHVSGDGPSHERRGAARHVEVDGRRHERHTHGRAHAAVVAYIQTVAGAGRVDAFAVAVDIGGTRDRFCLSGRVCLPVILPTLLAVLWVALTHGPPGAVTALAAVQIGIVIGAEIRFGADPGFGALQVLMTALAITGLIVGRSLPNAKTRLRACAISRRR